MNGNQKLRGAAAGRTAPGVDVIVPVFGAAAELADCLHSVRAYTALPPHHLILVVDGPQNPEVNEIIDAARSASDQVTILENPQRQGFVASVNRGMAHGHRDVVLLNSDTVVSAGWADKLAAAAASSSRVATVTPFSNNATLCSVPETLQCNLLPTDHDTESMAAVVEQEAERSYPRLPTGVGVCLYIRRAALDELGLFDEKSFGLGYGEETDFCLRARAAGWVHLLDDATFVFHHGRRSFGSGGRKREKSAERTIRRRHPGYYAELSRFFSDDPVQPARRRIRSALGAGSQTTRIRPKSVLHLVHGWPPFNHAGTEVYARSLAHCQANHREVSAYVRIADSDQATGAAVALLDRGVRTRLVVNNFDQRNPLARNALVNLAMERDFARFLQHMRPEIVHVHHLSGHSASLISVAAAHGARIVYQVQDWWALCARANLVRNDHQPCPGPTPGRCAACLPLTGLPPRWLLNRLLHLLRRRLLTRQLAHADAYVMGSQCIRGWYEQEGMLASGVPVHVLPYGISPLARAGSESPVAERPLRFGFVGSIMAHKGVHVLCEAFRGLDQGLATLEIWGESSPGSDYSRRLESGFGNNVRLMGRFDEAEKASVLSRFDLLLVPSVGLESFGIVAREAMALGVPVIASRLGALAEIELDGCGAFVPPGDAQELQALICRLAAQPEIVSGWRRNLPTVKTVREHSTEIEQVYHEVLGR